MEITWLTLESSRFQSLNLFVISFSLLMPLFLDKPAECRSKICNYGTDLIWVIQGVEGKKELDEEVMNLANFN